MTAPLVTDANFTVREFYDLGRVEIQGDVDPISLQANGSRKRAFQVALGEATRRATKGIFTGDVEITLLWLLDENRRYQTGSSEFRWG